MSGKLMMLAAAVMWSTAGIFVKYIPWSAFSIAAFRGFLGMLMLMAVRVRREKKGIRGILPKVTKKNVMIGVFMLATSLLYMSGIKLTSAANAIVLQYIAPVLVMLYAVLFESKRPSGFDVITTIVIFGGCVIAFAGQLSTDGVLGNILSILSGFAFAGQLISSGDKDADALDGMIIGSGLSVILTLPTLLNEPQENFALPIVLVAVAMGLIQYGGANIVYAYGAKRVNPLSASLILTLEPVLNPVWVLIFLGEVPSLLSVIGLCCVVGANVLRSVIGSKFSKV